MKFYQEMVVSQMKQMSEDNQQLIWLKNKVAKQKQNEKALVETVGQMSNQLRIATEDSRIVRLRSKIQYDENKEEVIWNLLINLGDMTMLLLTPCLKTCRST